jgi:hypothetical protein
MCCPNCGYCPHCGRSNPFRAVPIYPIQPQPIWLNPPYQNPYFTPMFSTDTNVTGLGGGTIAGGIAGTYPSGVAVTATLTN